MQNLEICAIVIRETVSEEKNYKDIFKLIISGKPGKKPKDIKE